MGVEPEQLVRHRDVNSPLHIFWPSQLKTRSEKSPIGNFHYTGFQVTVALFQFVLQSVGESFSFNTSTLQWVLLPPAGGDGEPDRSQHQTVIRLRGEGQGKHPAGRHVPEESAQGTSPVSMET